MRNSADPDQTAQSHLDLHCLHIQFYQTSSAKVQNFRTITVIQINEIQTIGFVLYKSILFFQFLQDSYFV